MVWTAEKQPKNAWWRDRTWKQRNVSQSEPEIHLQPCWLHLYKSASTSPPVWAHKAALTPYLVPPAPLAPAPPTRTIEEQKAPQVVELPPYEVQIEALPESTWRESRGSLGLKLPTSDFPTGAPGKIDSGEQMDSPFRGQRYNILGMKANLRLSVKLKQTCL